MGPHILHEEARMLTGYEGIDADLQHEPSGDQVCENG